MARAANQALIKFGARSPKDKNHPYAVINLDVLQKAMLDLDNNSFKLWLYIEKNQDGFELELSQKACESWGLKKDSYRRAKSELIQKNYLREVEPDVFEFNEMPVEEGKSNFCSNLTALDF